MSTLAELKKAAGLTNKDVAEALKCSTSKAGTILQGRHIHTYTDEEIETLAGVLGVSFARCWRAMQESYEAYMKTPAPLERNDERGARIRKEVYALLTPAMIPLEEEEAPRALTIDGALAPPLSITQKKEDV